MSLMNPCQTEWEQHFAISSTCEEASQLINTVLDQLRQHGWREDDIFAVHVALQESLSNAIKHGNRYDPSRTIYVTCRLTQQFFEASVKDEGAGFDPTKVPDPTLPENLDLPSGRGLRLITGFMDQVEFHNGGRQIVMRRYRGRSPEMRTTN